MLIADQARTVEHDLVLAADQVDVAHDRQRVGGARRDHAPALGRFSLVIGRCRQVEDDLGAAAHDLFLRRTTRQPDVLADVDAEHHAVAGEHQAVALGHEVAVLVEHAVVGQVALARRTDEAPVVQHGGRVVEVGVALERAHHDGHAFRVRGQVAGAVDAALDERRLQEQVLGRVPRDAHLGEGQQVDAEYASAPDGVDDPRDVAVEVPDGRIDLGEADPEQAHGCGQCGGRVAGAQARRAVGAPGAHP